MSMPIRADLYDKRTNTKVTGQKIIDQVFKLNKKYDVIIDIGCGTGYMTRLLAETFKPNRIIGVDVSHDMISYAQKHNKTDDSMDYLVEDMNQTWDQFSDTLRELEGRVSLIVSNRALHWIRDKRQLMAILSRLLARNGGTIVANSTLTPNLGSKLSPEDIQRYDLKLPSIQSFEEQITEWRDSCLAAGLTVQDLSTYVHRWIREPIDSIPDYIYAQYGPMFFVDEPKGSAKYEFMRNIVFDSLNRPMADRLNPRAIQDYQQQNVNISENPLYFEITQLNIVCLK